MMSLNDLLLAYHHDFLSCNSEILLVHFIMDILSTVISSEFLWISIISVTASS